MAMAETDNRLRRYLSDELGECGTEEYKQHLDELGELEELLDKTVVSEDVETLSALGSETRYRLVRLLVMAERELCVCEITPLFDVSESAISHALSTLEEADLVTKRKDGRWRKYRATNRASAVLTVLDGSR